MLSGEVEAAHVGEALGRAALTRAAMGATSSREEEAEAAPPVLGSKEAPRRGTELGAAIAVGSPTIPTVDAIPEKSDAETTLAGGKLNTPRLFYAEANPSTAPTLPHATYSEAAEMVVAAAAPSAAPPPAFNLRLSSKDPIPPPTLGWRTSKRDSSARASITGMPTAELSSSQLRAVLVGRGHKVPKAEVPQKSLVELCRFHGILGVTEGELEALEALVPAAAPEPAAEKHHHHHHHHHHHKAPPPGLPPGVAPPAAAPAAAPPDVPPLRLSETKPQPPPGAKRGAAPSDEVAAVRIQAAYRGYCDRAELAVWAEEELAFQKLEPVRKAERLLERYFKRDEAVRKIQDVWIKVRPSPPPHPPAPRPRRTRSKPSPPLCLAPRSVERASSLESRRASGCVRCVGVPEGARAPNASLRRPAATSVSTMHTSSARTGCRGSSTPRRSRISPRRAPPRRRARCRSGTRTRAPMGRARGAAGCWARRRRSREI